MIQLTKLKPRGDYAYEEGIQMVWTAWTRPRCCFNFDFCRTKGSGFISWSWLWVLSPIWLTFLFFAAIFSAILVGGRIAKGKW